MTALEFFRKKLTSARYNLQRAIENEKSCEEIQNIREQIEHYVVAVDALEKQDNIVHCKDCRNWGIGVPGETDHIKCCKYAKYMIGENGFCVYGEVNE